MIGIKLTIKSFLDSQINFQEKKNPLLGELRQSMQNLFLVPGPKVPYFYWFLLIFQIGRLNSTVTDFSQLIFRGKSEEYYHVSVFLNSNRFVILSSPELNMWP